MCSMIGAHISGPHGIMIKVTRGLVVVIFVVIFLFVLQFLHPVLLTSGHILWIAALSGFRVEHRLPGTRRQPGPALSETGEVQHTI